MKDFNPNLDSANTFNVQKLKLNKQTPNRYELNKQNFEAVLKQTLQSNKDKKKKRALPEMMSSNSSEDGGHHSIHLVSLDGPNPNI